MPRLTSATGLRLGFGVPAYAHPLVAPGEWAELARPGAPLHWVVLNVDRGPGVCPDPLYTDAVARLRDAGVPVLGLLDSVHGVRPFGRLFQDAHRYLDWYGVDGFYLDRAPSGLTELSGCRRVTTILRGLLGARGRVVLGHGIHPYAGYAEDVDADQLVTFCGHWTRYRWSETPQWTAAHPPARFCHLVHGVPGPHLDNAMRIARWQGAATVFFTDRAEHAPWEGLPAYWDQATRILRGQPRPGPPSM